MSTTIKTGWLNDKNGDKFAPKTLTSQVQTSDGVLLEDKINNLLDDKVDKVNGKILSTNDFTDDYKSKLESALTLGDVAIITIPEIDAICIIPIDPGLYQNGVMTMSWDELADSGVFNKEALNYAILVSGETPAADVLIGELVISDEIQSMTDTTLFQNCTSLTKITIPASVTMFSGNMFSGCTSLTEAVLFTDYIISYLFAGCTSLSKIEIPDQITSIGASAFNGCTNLTSFTIPNNGVNIQANAFSGSGLRSIVIPGNCVWTQESQACFSQCEALTTVVIEDGATLIPEYMFYKCSALSNVTIPASVTNIGVVAFGACTSLSSITFNGTMAQWNAITKSYAFEEGTPLAQIICSDGTITL